MKKYALVATLVATVLLTGCGQNNNVDKHGFIQSLPLTFDINGGSSLSLDDVNLYTYYAEDGGYEPCVLAVYNREKAQDDDLDKIIDSSDNFNFGSISYDDDSEDIIGIDPMVKYYDDTNFYVILTDPMEYAGSHDQDFTNCSISLTIAPPSKNDMDSSSSKYFTLFINDKSIAYSYSAKWQNINDMPSGVLGKFVAEYCKNHTNGLRTDK